jgi:hypothetical protein
MEDTCVNGLLNRASTMKPACPRVSTSAGVDSFFMEMNHELLAKYKNSHPVWWQWANKRGRNLKKTGG